ncbi:hypothetical protein BCR42DRAFT_414058, partial [Absidia repens]
MAYIYHARKLFTVRGFKNGFFIYSLLLFFFFFLFFLLLPKLVRVPQFVFVFVPLPNKLSS